MHVLAEELPPTRDLLLDAVPGAVGLVSLLSDTVDEELLDRAGPSLRIVANYAVGFDNVDVEACHRRGVAVAHTPGVLDDATADFTWALLLAVARRVREGHALVASGAWQGWSPLQLLGTQLSGRTIGIVGFGRIGQAVARRAAAFGMHVLYHAPTPRPEAERRLHARLVPLDVLLASSDVVTLHCPSRPETRHLIDESALRSMKSTAILVNTARGDVVDERALVQALRERWIAGAGLDVFEREPSLHPGLATLDNVTLAPHLGSATADARDAMARLVGSAVVSVLAGSTPPNLVPRRNEADRSELA